MTLGAPIIGGATKQTEKNTDPNVWEDIAKAPALKEVAKPEDFASTSYQFKGDPFSQFAAHEMSTQPEKATATTFEKPFGDFKAAKAPEDDFGMFATNFVSFQAPPAQNMASPPSAKPQFANFDSIAFTEQPLPKKTEVPPSVSTPIMKPPPPDVTDLLDLGAQPNITPVKVVQQKQPEPINQQWTPNTPEQFQLMQAFQQQHAQKQAKENLSSVILSQYNHSQQHLAPYPPQMSYSQPLYPGIAPPGMTPQFFGGQPSLGRAISADIPYGMEPQKMGGYPDSR